MPLFLPNDLTRRDLDILNVLWENGSSMTASQIVDAHSALTINTVQAVLRKLLKKKLIEIDKIVYSGTVLCRSYKPAISADEFALSHFNDEYTKLKGRISISALMSSLLDNETDSDILQSNISELKSMLDNYKRSIGSNGGQEA